MEELLAHLQEAKPSIWRRVLELVGAFRKWLRNRGLAKLAELGETDLMLLLKEAKQATIESDSSRDGATKFVVSDKLKRREALFSRVTTAQDAPCDETPLGFPGQAH